MFKKKPTPPKEIPQKRITSPIILEFSVGDIVRVCSEEAKVKELQNCKDCGGYSIQRMKGILGKLVKVKHITQYCVKVERDGFEFDLHPNLVDIIGAPMLIANSHETIDGSASLFEAIEQGNQSEVCVKINTDLLNTRNNIGRTPINAACNFGFLEIVEMFLEFNADINICDDYGYMPVHNCALKKHFELLKIMIERDSCQLHALTADGKSLLHISVMADSYEITKYLVDLGINILLEDNQKKTAFHYTASVQDSEHYGLLIAICSELSSLTLRNLTEESLSQSNVQTRVPTTSIEFSLFDPPKDGTNIPSTTASDFRTNQNNFNTIKLPSVSPLQISVSTKEIPKINEDQGKVNECKICYDRIKKVTFIKCGHTSCRECGEKLFHCPFCQKEIERLQDVFL